MATHTHTHTVAQRSFTQVQRWLEKTNTLIVFCSKVRVCVCLFVSSLESYQVYHFLHKKTTKTNFYIDTLTPNSSTIGSRLCWMGVPVLVADWMGCMATMHTCLHTHAHKCVHVFVCVCVCVWHTFCGHTFMHVHTHTHTHTHRL